MNTNKYKGLLAGLCTLLAIGSQPAQATLVSAAFGGQDENNDCAGFFGDSFDVCTVFIDNNGDTIELSPVIAKFNEDLDIPASEINNTVYPTVDGDEWEFSNLANSNGTGTWDYTPDDLIPDGDDFDPLLHDPGIQYWVAKSSNGFVLWWDVDLADIGTCADGAGLSTNKDNYTLDCLNLANTVETGTWSTELTTGGSPGPRGLSHLTFYDSEPVSNGGGEQEVPEPGVLALLGMGLLAGLLARRRLTNQG